MRVGIRVIGEAGDRRTGSPSNPGCPLVNLIQARHEILQAHLNPFPLVSGWQIRVARILLSAFRRQHGAANEVPKLGDGRNERDDAVLAGILKQSRSFLGRVENEIYQVGKEERVMVELEEDCLPLCGSQENGIHQEIELLDRLSNDLQRPGDQHQFRSKEGRLPTNEVEVRLQRVPTCPKPVEVVGHDDEVGQILLFVDGVYVAGLEPEPVDKDCQVASDILDLSCSGLCAELSEELLDTRNRRSALCTK